MALIKCHNCGNEISDKASCCIHCGYQILNNNPLENRNTTTNVQNTTNEKSKRPYIAIIIIPIITIVLTLIIVIIVNLSGSNEQKKVFCERELEGLTIDNQNINLDGSIEVFLESNNRFTKVSKTFEISSKNFESNSFIKDDTIKKYIEVSKKLDAQTICVDEMSKIKNKLLFKDLDVDCEHNGYDIHSEYIERKNIDKVLKEYEKNEFTCTEYYNENNNNHKLVGKWCNIYSMEIEDEIVDYNFYYKFNDDNSYTESKSFSDFEWEYTGFYTLEDNKIIELKKLVTTSSIESSYYIETYLTYDEVNDVIIDSNVNEKHKEHNKYYRCN